MAAKDGKATVVRLDIWAWNEIKALPTPWFSGLALTLTKALEHRPRWFLASAPLPRVQRCWWHPTPWFSGLALTLTKALEHLPRWFLASAPLPRVQCCWWHWIGLDSTGLNMEDALGRDGKRDVHALCIKMI